MKIAFVTAAIGLGVIISAPTADATPYQDAVFCQVQETAGIPCASNDRALAYQACSTTWNQSESVAVENFYYANYESSWAQAELFVQAAVYIYCPL